MPPGAASHLLQNLKRPFRRARIAVREADIGIDDADEREQRKIMSFGDELRADDDIAGAIGDGIEFLAQPRCAAGKIRREDERLRLRPEFRDFFRKTLDAGAAGRQRIDIVAFRAMLRDALDMAALMADERARKRCSTSQAGNSGTGNDGRRRGRASAAHSRAG